MRGQAMTVTKDQAQMIASLACASRPIGARQWNPQGVMTEIAKLHDRSLGSVILAVTRAAMDRDAERPAVINSAGSHWRDTRIEQAFVPHAMDSSERCSICSMTEASCRIRHSVDDHEFESAAMAAKRRAEADPDAVHGAVTALKDEVAHTEPRPDAPHGLEEYADRKPELRAKVDALRAQVPGLRSAPMREPESTMEAAE